MIPSLNEILAAYGLSVQPNPRTISVIDETGDVLFVGPLAAARAWAEEFDTIEDDNLAAFGEGSLSPAETRRMVLKLHVEGRSRAALRDLFPEVYAQHFED